MKSIEPYLARFLKYGTLLSTFALVATVLLQIVSRFMFEKAPSWTEEASRLWFIYSMAFAAGIALKQRYYVHLDYFYEKMSAANQKRLDVAIPLCTALLFGLMAIFSIPFIWHGLAETSPSMYISMAIAFLSMAILALGMTFYALRELFRSLKYLRK